MARDDLLNGLPCDNISERDKSYSEITAVYWAWKNIKKLYPNLEYIGVNHYRRYFSFKKNVPFSPYTHEPIDAVCQYKYDLKQLERILSAHDAVIPKPLVFVYSVATQYCVYHHRPDLQCLRRVVHNKYPEYDREMYNMLDKGNKLYPCNLCVMRWEDFDAYCTWLFDILFEADRQIIVDGNYNSWHGRVFGFMAERLFTVWVEHSGLKVKQLPYVWFTGLQNASAPRNACMRARYSLSFFFGKPWRKFSPERYVHLNGWKEN